MKWPVVKLHQLASPENGAIKIGPFGSQLKKSELTSAGIHVVGIENVLKSQFDGVGERYISERKFQELRSVEVQPGDVLITMMGTIGEVAIVPEGTRTSIMDSHLLRFRPYRKVCIPEYIKLIIKGSAETRAMLHGRAHGAIMKGLNSSIIRELPAPLPPLSEQQRIVRIIEQAEVLRKKRAEADAKAARILPALFYKMFGDPADWEATGSTEPLAKLVQLQGGGTPSKQNPDYWGGDIPWVSPKDMKRDFITDPEDHITQLALEETNSCLVPVDAILIVVRGMILARDVPVAMNVVPVTINQDMKALTVADERVSPLFLFAALKALGRRLRSNVGTAAHGTRKLDTDRLLSLPILIPEMQKHIDFVARFRELRQLDEKRATTAPRLERLFDVLLHRAFTGDLTAKWREAHMKELVQEMEHQAKALGGWK